MKLFLTLLLASAPQEGAGLPATFCWGDYDEDGLEDALVIQPDGSARLLKNLGDGTFENVTDLLGLPAMPGARGAAWADYDADGRLDLFVASAAGEGALLRQAESGLFVDVSSTAGIADGLVGEAARWVDFDVDGQPDLLVSGAGGEHLFHNLGGAFAAVDLGRPALAPVWGLPGEDASAPGAHTAAGRAAERTAPGLARPDVGGDAGRLDSSVSGITRVGAGATQPMGFEQCVDTIKDQADGLTCVNVSSAPTAGMLYPLGSFFFISPGGFVGINELSPVERLHVAGDARIDSDSDVNVGVGSGALSVASIDGLRGLSIDQNEIQTVGANNTLLINFNNQNETDIQNGALFVDTTKYVGLGTSSPTSRLSIAGTDDPLDGPILRLQNPGNPFEAGRVRLCESTATFLGGYLHYDGVGNELNLGVHDVNSVDPANDIDAITIARSNGSVGVGKSPTVVTARLDVGGGGNFDGLLTARTVEVESVTGGGTGIRITQDGVTSGTAIIIDSTNANSKGVDVQLTGAGIGTGIGVRSVVAGTNSQAVFGSTSGGLASTAVRGQATGAGVAGRFEGATNVALVVSRADNAGDILTAGNPGDIEFRVESSGNVLCDGAFIDTGADYAEYLERSDYAEAMMPGDVVGVRGGKISKDLTGAEQILVISTNPALVGNAADAESTGRDGYEVTAFLGQVPVRVRGVVRSGDFLLPSGRHDGTAVAVGPRDLRAEQLARVLGRAWESSDEPGAKTVNAAIGLDEAAAAACVIDSLRAELERVAALETRLAAVEARLFEDSGAVAAR